MAVAFAGQSAESRQRIYSVMTGFSIRSLLAAPVAAVLGLALAACSQTTYGTGKSPGAQTLEDIAGIAALGGPSDKEPIDYRARPKIVAPPPGSPLPAPGSEPDPAVAANWPKDPDVEAKKFKAEVAARNAEADRPFGKYDPKFALPKQQTASREPSPTLVNMDPSKAASEAAHMTADEAAKAKKLFADARGNIAVDENGKPIRRYLTDPPSDYREPDPTAPVEVDNKPAANTKKKAGWKWPWE